MSDKSRIGDMYIYEDEELNVEQECMVVEVAPMHLILVTSDNIWLKAVKGINSDKFIPIRDIAAL